MQIIMLSGKQGSGKTTLQELLYGLLVQFGCRPAKVNFADFIYSVHNFALEELRKVGIDRDMKKDGRLLQLLGTEWGRDSISKDIWCDVMKGKIQNLEREGFTHAIIGDCRFENEFDYFPSALRVRLQCEREVRKTRCTQWREADFHASETGLDLYLYEDKFDLEFATDILTPEECAKKIFEKLGLGFKYTRGDKNAGQRKEN